MGIWRFILACLVVLQHTPGHYSPFNYSASAVITFYFISGYLMSLSLTRFSDHTHVKSFFSAKFSIAHQFYLDRIIRLYPIFLVGTILAYLVSTHLGTIFSISDIILNLSVLPLAYHNTTFPMNPIDAPMWSLGVEFHFYLLAPLFFFLNRKLLIASIFIILSVHLLGAFIEGQMAGGLPGVFILGNPQSVSEFIGYRFFGTTFGFFLLGILVSKYQEYKIFYSVIIIYALCFFIFGQGGGGAFTSYSFDVWFAIVFFFPFTLLILNTQISDSLKGINNYLGKLSWPLFAVHWPVVLLCEHYIATSWIRFAFVFFLSIFLSIILSSMQNMIDTYRYKVRGFKKLKTYTI